MALDMISVPSSCEQGPDLRVGFPVESRYLHRGFQGVTDVLSFLLGLKKVSFDVCVPVSAVSRLDQRARWSLSDPILSLFCVPAGFWWDREGTMWGVCKARHPSVGELCATCHLLFLSRNDHSCWALQPAVHRLKFFPEPLCAWIFNILRARPSKLPQTEPSCHR